MSLKKQLCELIKRNGPVPLDQFLSICISYYYDSRDPLGREGDFITAPEISQMFGEIIGVWCVNTWINLGKVPFNLVEIGGGRGTLMDDILRATKHIKDFSSAIKTIYMVETSSKLQELQQKKLAQYKYNLSYCNNFEEIDSSTSIIINNEFFDALPIKQFKKTDQGFQELLVGYHNEEFILLPSPIVSELKINCNLGDIIELSPARTNYFKQITKFLNKQGGACLVVDYGYLNKPLKSTLQAVKNHKYHNIFKGLGEADLTSLVDFGELIKICSDQKIKYRFFTQREFLISYGIEIRAEQLISKGAKNSTINSELNRLISPHQMGNLFKVLELTKTTSH